jgi:hypothetical protein
LLLRIKSIGRYIHHKELKVVCHYMEKESWRLQSYFFIIDVAPISLLKTTLMFAVFFYRIWMICNSLAKWEESIYCTVSFTDYW